MRHIAIREGIQLLIKAINVLLIAHGYEVKTEERDGWTMLAYRLPGAAEPPIVRMNGRRA